VSESGREEREAPEEAVLTVRDKDNAAPRIKPPELAHVPHPRLAPPGMSGIKMGLPAMERSVGVPPLRHASKTKEEGRAKKAFTPLVSTQPTKGKSHDR
jgi:hypothetical protein